MYFILKYYIKYIDFKHNMTDVYTGAAELFLVNMHSFDEHTRLHNEQVLLSGLNRFNQNLKKQNLGIFYNSVKATISTNQFEFK